jgi:hypothetical protein
LRLVDYVSDVMKVTEQSMLVTVINQSKQILQMRELIERAAYIAEDKGETQIYCLLREALELGKDPKEGEA